MRRRRCSPLALAAALAAAAVAASRASASQLIDRNAAGVRLTVNARGEALPTYRALGRTCRALGDSLCRPN